MVAGNGIWAAAKVTAWIPWFKTAGSPSDRKSLKTASPLNGSCLTSCEKGLLINTDKLKQQEHFSATNILITANKNTDQSNWKKLEDVVQGSSYTFSKGPPWWNVQWVRWKCKCFLLPQLTSFPAYSYQLIPFVNFTAQYSFEVFTTIAFAIT